MNKPAGYDEAKATFGYEKERITPGGHRCVIVKVIEKKSSTGKEQLEIHLDTAADDSQPMLFSNQFAQNGSGAWPCRFWITGYETEGSYGVRQLKAFHTAVEDSNGNFVIPWGAGYAAALKGKKVGVVFGQEENEWNGRISTLTKPRYFRNIEDVENAEIPQKKTLEKEAPAATGSEDWLQVPDGVDDTGLPFN